MKGRVALVTGGSRGIGRAIVARFEELGARVIAPSRTELDLADPAGVEAYANGVSDAVDILVNDAGVNPLAGVGDLSDADLEETLAVNLVAPLRLCRCLAPRMAERGYGRIVNISSVWSIVSKPRRLTYTISKSGLNGLTRALAVELGPHGVLVNAVAPGYVATELTAQNNTPDELAAIVANIPLRRLATPEEIAELVSFLCSRRNAYATGQVVVCDGGYSSV
jgi:NAD(P)-dependent dehydrogenase (short-subunit alcohol dehydrogenase family)